MRFRLAAVGKIDRTLAAACQDYAERIKRYIKFEVTEVAESRNLKNAADVKKREGRTILSAIPPGAGLITVTRDGSPRTSRELSQRLQQWQQDARDIVFAIGGSEGFSNEVMAASSESVSLSPLTLPHDLARLVFLEQIYRACTILRGEPYHRGP